MDTDFYTATEAAKKLGISKELMARYCRQKRIGSCVRKGRIWFIPASSLKIFQNIQRRYKSGRPMSRFPAIFWREPLYPDLESAVHILATRAPFMIPKIVPKTNTKNYISSAKTKLEKIIRETMINALYGDFTQSSVKETVCNKIFNIVNRRERADVYALCQIFTTYPFEFKQALENLCETEETSELLIRIQRCLEMTDGRGTKEVLTENERIWMEKHVPGMIKEIIKSSKN